MEEQHRSRSAGKGGDSDVQVMHDFIRKQAVNQQADYSVSKGTRGRHRFCLVLGEAEIDQPQEGKLRRRLPSRRVRTRATSQATPAAVRISTSRAPHLPLQPFPRHRVVSAAFRPLSTPRENIQSPTPPVRPRSSSITSKSAPTPNHPSRRVLRRRRSCLGIASILTRREQQGQAAETWSSPA